MTPPISNLNKSIDFLHIAALLVTLVAMAILSASPVEDGDFWWQMAYGRYMLENLTLIPLHSTFSWTPARDDIIYCAWIPEVLLYVTHKYFGIFGASMFRYLSMLTPALLVIWMARRQQRPIVAPIWFYIFLCYFISRHAAGFLKPEMFSYLLFSCLVALFFAIKSSNVNRAKLIYAIPLLILIWVNTHAGFIIGILFLCVAVVGESFNRLVRSSFRLDKSDWKHVWISIPLTIVAVCITPYGIDYPIQLIQQYLTGDHNGAYKHVSAYKSIFSSHLAELQIPKYMGICIVLLIPLFVETIKNRQVDYSLILLNLVFLVISSGWGRFSYFFPVITLFTFVHLTRDSAIWNSFLTRTRLVKWISVVCIVYMVFLTIQTVRAGAIGDSRGGPFQNGYLNPHSEAEFVQTYYSDKKVCNGYNGGGYLLWKLWPQQKVMIDPRYFPYASWHNEWVKLTTAANPQSHIETYDCDLWVLNHTYPTIASTLVSMPEWQLVFIGSSGAVFVKPGLADKLAGIEIAVDVATLRSLPRTGYILNLLLQEKNYDLALKVASNARRHWARTGNEQRSQKAYDFVRGTIAFQASDDFVAYRLLKKANEKPFVITNENRLIKAGQFLTELYWQQGNIQAAKAVATEVFELDSENLINLFNTGSLILQTEYQSDSDKINERNSFWRQYLTKFVQRSEQESVIPRHYIQYAKDMLESGKSVNKPPLRPHSTRGKSN